MEGLSLESMWTWILLGIAAVIAGWWAMIREPGADSGKIFAPAVGLVLVLLLMVYFRGAGTGQLPTWF